MLKKEDNIIGLKGITAFLLYFITFIIKSIFTSYLYLANVSMTFLNLYSLIFTIIQIFLLIFIFKDKLIIDFNDLKLNYKNYINKYLKYWYLSLLLMGIANALIYGFVSDNLPANEENVRALFSVAPFIIFTSAVFVAPVLEELVFRLSFRYMFKTDLLFILFSGIVFGAFHVLLSGQSLVELLYIIPYSIPGLAFALALKKSNNVFVPIGLHFTHNCVLMVLQLIALFGGVS